MDPEIPCQTPQVIRIVRVTQQCCDTIWANFQWKYLGQGRRMAIASARKRPLVIRVILHQGMGILLVEESVLIWTDESGTHQD